MNKVVGFLFLTTVPLVANDAGPEESSTDNTPKLWVGNVSVTSNYVFRGISISNNKPALQGGLTLNDIWAQSGIYLNVWGSSIHFPDAVGKTAHLEIDTTVGVTNTIGKHFNYNVYAVRYNYPDAKGVSYNEVIASGQFYFLTAFVGYSSNVMAKHKDGTYVNVGFKYNIPEDVIELKSIVISGGIGYYDLPRSAGLRSYVDYNLQVRKSYEPTKELGLVVALEWTNTNRKSTDPSRLKRNHVLGTVTLNF